MSGTVEEANTSAYIAAQFEAMGMSVTEHSYQVPMHHVNSEPSLRICVQGFGGNSPCEGPLAFGSQINSSSIASTTSFRASPGAQSTRLTRTCH